MPLLEGLARGRLRPGGALGPGVSDPLIHEIARAERYRRDPFHVVLVDRVAPNRSAGVHSRIKTANGEFHQRVGGPNAPLNWWIVRSSEHPCIPIRHQLRLA